MNDAGNFTCDAEIGKTLFTKDSTVTPPRPLYTPDASYTKAARDHHVQGIVKLSVVIGADGRIHEVKVLQPLEPSLDEKAIEAVKMWKFAPATKDGRPVAAQIDVEVSFQLK